jgi:sugar phosphate isomerase/epimerase
VILLLGRLFWSGAFPGMAADTMADVIDHIQACYVLLAQQIYRLTFLLAEDRHQDIGSGDLLAT